MARRRSSIVLGVDRRGGGGSPTESFSTFKVAGQTNVVAEQHNDELTFVAGANMTITTNPATDTITFASSGSGGLADDDYGDITVGGSGTTMTINPTAVTFDKVQDIATDSFLGRDTSGDGMVEVLSVATVKTLLGLTGTNSGDQNLFSTIAVSGESDVVADSTSDTLTIIAGNNMTITTSAGGDSITFESEPAGNAWTTVSVSGQDDVLAETSTSTLTLIAGANMTITTNAVGGTITFASSGEGGGGLSDGDYGDITVSGTGTVMTIDPAAVTLSKFQDIATDSFLGRDTAGTGSPEVLSVATVKTLLNLAGSNTGDQTITLTGDVTGSGTGSFAATIANSAVTLAKIQNIATDSFLGRDTTGTGVVEVLSVATVKTLLGLTGTNSGDQTITLTGDVTGTGTGTFAATIANSAVTLAKIQNIATDSFLGRDTAGTGVVEVLSIATVKTMLGIGDITGTNTGDQNLFSTIAVSGQSNVVADATSDTLTLANGGNITITTNAGTDTVTLALATTPSINGVAMDAVHTTDVHQIQADLEWNNAAVNFTAWELAINNSASGGSSLILNFLVNAASVFSVHKSGNVTTAGSITATGAITGSNLSGTNTGNQNVFSTVAVSGQSNVVADGFADTLTLAAGSGIAITTNATTDTVTIATTGLASASFTTIAVSGQSNVVADSTADTLTLAAGSNIAITTNAGTDTVTVAVTGLPTVAFSTIAVSGQSNVVADAASDTLTLAAGSNIAITTNAGSDTVTIAATGLPTVAFSTITVAGQSNVVADSASDTLTLVAGSNMTITTSAGGDTITFNASGGGGGSEANVTFTTTSHALTDVDIGKPIFLDPSDDSGAVWDDTAPNTYPTGLLFATPVGDDLELATISHTVTFSEDLMSTSDLATNGRWFYWDADYLEDSDVSDNEPGMWVPEPPIDSWKQISIEVLTIAGGQVFAIVHAPF